MPRSIAPQTVSCRCPPAGFPALAAILAKAGFEARLIEGDRGSEAEAAGLILVDARTFVATKAFTDYLAEASGGSARLGIVDGDGEEAESFALMAEADARGVWDLCRREELGRQLGPRLALLSSRVSGPASAPRSDALTGLGSRQEMRRILTDTLGLPFTEGAIGAWILDFDRFKMVNDKWGHAAGDEVLRRAAAIILASPVFAARSFRLGGDEFAGIVGGRSKSEVTELLQELRQALKTLPIRIGDARIPVTVTIGYTFLRPAMGAEAAFTEADNALYAGKAAGRDRIQCHDLCWDAAEADPGKVALDHFENVTRVWTERMSELIRSVGRRAMEESLRSAERDGLTGLYNRAYFDRRMAREVDNARKAGAPLSLALLDIDDFHGVNVEFGYPTGDAALRAVAELARNHSRVTDWVARYGGEEFVIVMPSTAARDAALVAERFREALEAAEIAGFGERRLSVTASVGIAALAARPDDAATPVALVQEASDRVMAAKREGKNRVVSPDGVTAGAPPRRRAGRETGGRTLRVLVLDDKPHARDQVADALAAIRAPSHEITWVDSLENLRALKGSSFDLAFVDFFLSKDRSYGTDALADIKADTLVGFSSMGSASDLIELEARKHGFRDTAAVEKRKASLANPDLERWLGDWCGERDGNGAGAAAPGAARQTRP